jgi:nucleotidyltransferase/DNA polymerase involved in DNA repair
MFTLVDGNNFYVSCERVFRPSLNDHPVIVLSSNDAVRLCTVMRQALGIKLAHRDSKSGTYKLLKLNTHAENSYFTFVVSESNVQTILQLINTHTNSLNFHSMQRMSLCQTIFYICITKQGYQYF